MIEGSVVDNSEATAWLLKLLLVQLRIFFLCRATVPFVSYTATVINIMIASPSDVAQERQVARNVITEWNIVHAKDKSTVLMPIGWETHSVPDTGNRPQAIINGQLLKDADLLVAIFWTRIGSPTGAAQSGTVEEIEEHIAAGKPAMIYFSSTPVLPDSIDNNQYAAVKAFKESLKERGLFQGYEDLTDFHRKFTRQLAQNVILKFPGTSSTTDAKTPVAETSILTLPVPTESLNTIGDAARELLVEAAKDSQGTIMKLRTMDGSSVQANGRNFVEGGKRSAAKWRSAVDELHRLRLIEDLGGKGEVFFITDDGYRLADFLAPQ